MKIFRLPATRPARFSGSTHGQIMPDGLLAVGVPGYGGLVGLVSDVRPASSSSEDILAALIEYDRTLSRPVVMTPALAKAYAETFGGDAAEYL